MIFSAKPKILMVKGATAEIYSFSGMLRRILFAPFFNHKFEKFPPCLDRRRRPKACFRVFFRDTNFDIESIEQTAVYSRIPGSETLS